MRTTYILDAFGAIDGNTRPGILDIPKTSGRYSRTGDISE
jgi:hypothetical protein